MNLERCYKIPFFFIALLANLLVPSFYPGLKLYFFAPFLIITYYQLNQMKALWLSLACGTIVDCLSVNPFFGLHACVYFLSTFSLYSQKKHFYAYRMSTLPLMTALFSITATLLFLFSASVLEGRELLSVVLIYTDLILMPGIDGVYAWICFALPLQLVGELRRQRRKRRA